VTNPLEALPHIIGIGGGQTINLADEQAALAQRIREGTIGQNDLLHAYNRANAHFSDLPSSSSPLYDVYTKMRDGKQLGVGSDPVKNAEELRYGYAITVAYLDVSGELEQRRQAVSRANAPTDDSRARLSEDARKRDAGLAERARRIQEEEAAQKIKAFEDARREAQEAEAARRAAEAEQARIANDHNSTSTPPSSDIPRASIGRRPRHLLKTQGPVAKVVEIQSGVISGL
jgi:hypothetical protein